MLCGLSVKKLKYSTIWPTHFPNVAKNSHYRENWLEKVVVRLFTSRKSVNVSNTSPERLILSLRKWHRLLIFTQWDHLRGVQHANFVFIIHALFIIWVAPWVGKMNQIPRCNWLPERARRSDLARSGLRALSREKNFSEAGVLSYIINPLLTKLVRSRWLDIGLVLFCEFMDLDFVSVHKHAKKNLANIQPSWPLAWSITHTYKPRVFVTFLTQIIGNS